MNNKMKISLLGTLIAGSSLAVALPMVSCSAEESVIKPQPIKKIINASINKNNWIVDMRYIIASPELKYFYVRFAEINKDCDTQKNGYINFETERYTKFDIQFESINNLDWKNPKNYFYTIAVFGENDYFKIDNIEFKKAKVFVDYDSEYDINSKIRIEKII